MYYSLYNYLLSSLLLLLIMYSLELLWNNHNVQQTITLLNNIFSLNSNAYLGYVPVMADLCHRYSCYRASTAHCWDVCWFWIIIKVLKESIQWSWTITLNSEHVNEWEKEKIVIHSFGTGFFFILYIINTLYNYYCMPAYIITCIFWLVSVMCICMPKYCLDVLGLPETKNCLLSICLFICIYLSIIIVNPLTRSSLKLRWQ